MGSAMLHQIQKLLRSLQFRHWGEQEKEGDSGGGAPSPHETQRPNLPPGGSRTERRREEGSEKRKLGGVFDFIEGLIRREESQELVVINGKAHRSLHGRRVVLVFLPR